MAKDLEQDIERFADIKWNLVLAEGKKIGNLRGGFQPVAIMKEPSYKELVRELLTVGIQTGVTHALKQIESACMNGISCQEKYDNVLGKLHELFAEVLTDKTKGKLDHGEN